MSSDKDRGKAFGAMLVVTGVFTIPTFGGHWGPLVAWLGLCLCYSLESRNP